MRRRLPFLLAGLLVLLAGLRLRERHEIRIASMPAPPRVAPMPPPVTKPELTHEVAGLVLDAASRASVVGATVELVVALPKSEPLDEAPIGPAALASSSSGTDGRFLIAAEAGRYFLRVRAPGYATLT